MKSVFASFWSGGFESASHINRHGQRLDLIATTQHDQFAVDDYRLLSTMGLHTARDAVRWPLVDRSGEYQFESFVPMLKASLAAGIQVNWTLCHYGWPDDIDILSARFVDRFARYAAGVASVVAGENDDVPLYTPINEPSFLAWAAGNAGVVRPDAPGRDNEIKRQLVRATIAAVDAIRDVDRRARFVHVDPIIHVVARAGHPDEAPNARAYAEAQYEACDLLTGAKEPELGGRPEYLDIVGWNYYHSSQWELGGATLPWSEDSCDPRRAPLNELLRRAHERFRRPMILAETSHVGSGRAAWIMHVSVAVAHAIRDGVPIDGVCIFPVIDRPDWEDTNHWHNSGLWDMERCGDRLERVLNEPYAMALRAAQSRVQAARDEKFSPARLAEAVDGADG